MTLVLLAKATLMVTVAFFLQISLMVAFAREAVLTKEGHLCRLKCTLASLMYATIATLLTYYMLTGGAE